MTTAKRELKDFHFRLKGHGQDIDAGTYRTEKEEQAFREALKNCKRFEMPGWSLHCTDTGTSQSVALAYDTDGNKVRV